MEIRRLAAAACVLLGTGVISGCLTEPIRTVFREPVYNFVTTDEIGLREEAEDEGHIVAVLPRGTPVAPIGVNSECNCWQVEALGHTGYVYTRFLSGPILNEAPAEP
jgi:hypothetical protein